MRGASFITRSFLSQQCPLSSSLDDQKVIAKEESVSCTYQVSKRLWNEEMKGFQDFVCMKWEKNQNQSSGKEEMAYSTYTAIH